MHFHSVIWDSYAGPRFSDCCYFCDNEQTLMSSLAKAKQQSYSADYSVEGMMGINNAYWDEWEEWMGWEGAGTLDYSSHINIYA